MFPNRLVEELGCLAGPIVWYVSFDDGSKSSRRSIHPSQRLSDWLLSEKTAVTTRHSKNLRPDRKPARIPFKQKAKLRHGSRRKMGVRSLGVYSSVEEAPGAFSNVREAIGDIQGTS